MDSEDSINKNKNKLIAQILSRICESFAPRKNIDLLRDRSEKKKT